MKLDFVYQLRFSFIRKTKLRIKKNELRTKKGVGEKPSYRKKQVELTKLMKLGFF